MQLYVTSHFCSCIYDSFHLFDFYRENKNFASPKNTPIFLKFKKQVFKALFGRNLHFVVWFKNDMYGHFNFLVELKKVLLAAF